MPAQRKPSHRTICIIFPNLLQTSELSKRCRRSDYSIQLGSKKHGSSVKAKCPQPSRFCGTVWTSSQRKADGNYILHMRQTQIAFESFREMNVVPSAISDIPC